MNIEQRLQLALEDFDKAHNDILHLLESRNRDLLWKPHPKKWSPAQSIEHILVSNELYFPLIEDKLAAKGDARKNQSLYKPTFWGKMVYRAVDPDLMKTKKSKAPKLFNPQPSVEIPTLIRRFEKDQIRLKKCLERALENDATQKLRSPVSRIMRFTLVDVMAILSKHEIRHYLQAKNILSLRG